MDSVQQFTQLKDRLASLEKEEATLKGSLEANEKQRNDILGELQTKFKIKSGEELASAIGQINDRLTTLTSQAQEVFKEVGTLV